LRDVEIHLQPAANCDEVARAIDDAITQTGLNAALRDSLKKFPGCIHWHAKNGRLPGTLEITLWPEKHRAWFTVQSGRAAPWMDAKMRLIQEAIRRRMGDR
jgi:hypothetical protein